MRRAGVEVCGESSLSTWCVTLDGGERRCSGEVSGAPAVVFVRGLLWLASWRYELHTSL
jgi:hypothetical protein